MPERTAAERGEPEAEDGTDVAVTGRAHDPLSHPARCFVQHDEDEPLDDLRRSGTPVRMGADHFVHGGIDAPLLATVVLVEAFPRLAAQPAALDHAGERGDRRKPLPERLVHHPDHLLPHVHPHLVQQRDRPDGEAELDHQPVDLFDRDTFDQQMACLVHIGCENSVDPEPWTVLHDDRGLAHAAAEPDSGADDLGRRARRRNHLEQRHPGHGREKVHPDDLLRPACGFGDPVYRDGRRVRCEHRVRRGRRFDFTQHLLLDLEILEHRLDDQLGAAKAGVAIAPREQRDQPGVLVGRDAASLEPVVEDLARGGEPLRDPRKIGVLHADVYTGLSDRGARNARPHEPRAHDAEPADDGGRRWVGDPEVLLERGGGEEDLDQLARDVGDGELAEQLRLALQPLHHAVLEPVLDRLQRRERRRVVATRLREDLLPGRPEDQAPAQRVAVEQPPPEATRPLAPRAPTARHALRGGDGHVLEDGGVHQLIHDAQPERLPGVLDFAREDDVERRPGTDQPGEPLAAAGPRENAELHFREAELGPGVIGGHAVPAGEGELEPAAEARAVNPGGDRFGEARHPAQHFLALGREPLGFRGGGEPDELLDVGPRDEVLGLPREEGDRPHGGVVL